MGVSDWLKRHPLVGVVRFPALPGAIDYRGTAREELYYRRASGAEEIAVFADVHDRTGVPLAGMTLEETAHEAVWFGKADGLVITGRNEVETLEWLQRVKRAAPDVPIWAGGGATTKNISRLLEVADGVIVATAAKVGGQLLNPVDRQAAEALNSAANGRRIHQGMMAKS